MADPKLRIGVEIDSASAIRGLLQSKSALAGLRPKSARPATVPTSSPPPCGPAVVPRPAAPSRPPAAKPPGSRTRSRRGAPRSRPRAAASPAPASMSLGSRRNIGGCGPRCRGGRRRRGARSRPHAHQGPRDQRGRRRTQAVARRPRGARRHQELRRRCGHRDQPRRVRLPRSRSRRQWHRRGHRRRHGCGVPPVRRRAARRGQCLGRPAEPALPRLQHRAGRADPHAAEGRRRLQSRFAPVPVRGRGHRHRRSQERELRPRRQRRRHEERLEDLGGVRRHHRQVREGSHRPGEDPRRGRRHPARDRLPDRQRRQGRGRLPGRAGQAQREPHRVPGRGRRCADAGADVARQCGRRGRAQLPHALPRRCPEGRCARGFPRSLRGGAAHRELRQHPPAAARGEEGHDETLASINASGRLSRVVSPAAPTRPRRPPSVRGCRVVRRPTRPRRPRSPPSPRAHERPPQPDRRPHRRTPRRRPRRPRRRGPTRSRRHRPRPRALPRRLRPAPHRRAQLLRRRRPAAAAGHRRPAGRPRSRARRRRRACPQPCRHRVRPPARAAEVKQLRRRASPLARRAWRAGRSTDPPGRHPGAELRCGRRALQVWLDLALQLRGAAGPRSPARFLTDANRARCSNSSARPATARAKRRCCMALIDARVVGEQMRAVEDEITRSLERLRVAEDSINVQINAGLLYRSGPRPHRHPAPADARRGRRAHSVLRMVQLSAVPRAIHALFEWPSCATVSPSCARPPATSAAAQCRVGRAPRSSPTCSGRPTASTTPCSTASGAPSCACSIRWWPRRWPSG